jgi:hypothetical protein
MSEPQVVVHSSAEENGMANMVAELIRTNIAASAYKASCFRLLDVTVALEVPDAEVSATLVFKGGSCVIYDGVDGKTDLTIVADSESLLQLSNLSLVAGLPFYLDSNGVDVIGRLIDKKVKISGMVCHPLDMTLLTIVLSVN